jgi:RNA polymerase sigma-70 factor (subfamily 1)
MVSSLEDQMDDHEQEQFLISQSVDGDRVALEQLLTLHSFQLKGHIAAKLPRSLQGLIGVDDIMQQTFLDAFRHIGRFEFRTDGSFSAWLKTIADRNLQNNVKLLGRKKRLGDRNRAHAPMNGSTGSLADLVAMLSAGSHTPSRSAARHVAVDAIRQVIQELPQDYRQAVELRLLCGRSLEDVALAMNRSPRAVQGLVDRAKKKMRNALGRLSRFE